MNACQIQIISRVFLLQKAFIKLLCFLEDGRLALYNSNKTIFVFSRGNYELEDFIENDDDIYTICGVRNECLAFAGWDKLINIWQIGKGKCKKLHVLYGHEDRIWKVIKLENGRLCSCSDDKTIRIWDDKNKYKCIQILVGHLGFVKSIIEVNKYIISIGSFYSDPSLRVWDKSTYECVKTIKINEHFEGSSLEKMNEFMAVFWGKDEIFLMNTFSFQYELFKNNYWFNKICSIYPLKNGNIFFGNEIGEIGLFDPVSNKLILKKNIFPCHSSVNNIIKVKDQEIFVTSGPGVIYIYELIGSST